MIKDELKRLSKKVLKWIIFIVASLILIQFCAYANTYISNAVEAIRLFKYDILILLFGAVMVAPLTEEFTKRIACKCGFLYLYAAMFGFLEMFIYVSMGADWAMRFPVVFVHLFFASIHKYFEEKSIKEGNKYISWIGFLLAVMCHAAYNFTVSLLSM